jgi:hypothetical protein
MTSIDDPNYQKKLEFLYARRLTLDTLIRTLEQYDRFQGNGQNLANAKTVREGHFLRIG